MTENRNDRTLRRSLLVYLDRIINSMTFEITKIQYIKEYINLKDT